MPAGLPHGELLGGHEQLAARALRSDLGVDVHGDVRRVREGDQGQPDLGPSREPLPRPGQQDDDPLVGVQQVPVELLRVAREVGDAPHVLARAAHESRDAAQHFPGGVVEAVGDAHLLDADWGVLGHEGISVPWAPADARRGLAWGPGDGKGARPAGRAPHPLAPGRRHAPTTTSVAFGSTGMPGPNVVDTVALVM